MHTFRFFCVLLTPNSTLILDWKPRVSIMAALLSLVALWQPTMQRRENWHYDKSWLSIRGEITHWLWDSHPTIGIDSMKHSWQMLVNDWYGFIKNWNNHIIGKQNKSVYCMWKEMIKMERSLTLILSDYKVHFLKMRYTAEMIHSLQSP